MITMQDYQVRAHETAEYSTGDAVKDLAFLVLSLNAHSGLSALSVATELVSNKPELTQEQKQEKFNAMAEAVFTVIGNILWTISEISSTMDWNLSELARANLANRKQMVEEAGKGDKEGKDGGKW